jgi:predicted regulator of Ras-like GTPase activity (Roadblock/LC7/MglB family)
MEGQKGTSSAELVWLLDDLVSRVPEVERALILSRDGLAVAVSSEMKREDAEHLSAIAAGFQSLARGMGGHFGGGNARQIMVEMDGYFLFVTAAGKGSCLAVLTSSNTDVGLVAYEMAVLVKRVGRHLSVSPRLVPDGDRTE